MTQALITAIEAAWENRAQITPASTDVAGVVDEVLGMLRAR